MYKKQESIFKLFSKINKQEVENKCKVEPVSITLIKNSKHIALYIKGWLYCETVTYKHYKLQGGGEGCTVSLYYYYIVPQVSLVTWSVFRFVDLIRPRSCISAAECENRELQEKTTPNHQQHDAIFG